MEEFDADKLENAMQTVMKMLANCLSSQRGIQYEFGPEYTEYLAQKATGTLKQSHLRPLSEIFSDEQLDKIPIDNKVGENYFGELSEQLRKKGGSAFCAVGERLVLSSNADLAFSKGSEKMLKDKELKKRKKEIEQLDAQWSKAQKDVARARIAVSDAEADILAREQAKNKQISDCKRNGEKFNYEAPMSSQADVNKMFTKIQKLSEQDRLSIMRKEVKLKKMMFSQLPADFVLFKQYNLSSSQMYKNLLDLHAVDPANQETVSKADIYVATDDLSVNPSLTASKTKKKTREAQVDTSETSLVEAEWPPHDEEFIVSLEEDGWSICSVLSFDETSNSIKAQQLNPLKTRAKDDVGKTYWVYSDEENVDTYEEKHILSVRPSLTLAKNIKRKEPVFALLNREFIEAFSSDLY